MSKSKINKTFIESIEPIFKKKILRAIADHYGVSTEAIHDEVTQEGAEYLFEYTPSPLNTQIYSLMKEAVEDAEKEEE